MFVKTVKSLKVAYQNYMLKQKAQLIQKDEHTAVAKLGEEVFVYSDWDHHWCSADAKDDRTIPGIQWKLNQLLRS